MARSFRRAVQHEGADPLIPQEAVAEALPAMERSDNRKRLSGGSRPPAPGGPGGPDGSEVTQRGVLRLSSRATKQEGQPTGPEGQPTAQPDGAPPLDDARVDAAKRGDPSAWEAAYLVYGRALMGYLMMRLDNRDDAAEALSETFARAIDKASSFRGNASAFRAWLFSIARNVSTDRYRSRARLVVLADLPEDDDRPQPSGEDLVIHHEDVVELRRGFALLSVADQEVLWLRVCSGLSADDVGKVLGKRAGAVRMQQLRALEALRGQMRP